MKGDWIESTCWREKHLNSAEGRQRVPLTEIMQYFGRMWNLWSLDIESLGFKVQLLFIDWETPLGFWVYLTHPVGKQLIWQKFSKNGWCIAREARNVTCITSTLSLWEPLYEVDWSKTYSLRTWNRWIEIYPQVNKLSSVLNSNLYVLQITFSPTRSWETDPVVSSCLPSPCAPTPWVTI